MQQTSHLTHLPSPSPRPPAGSRSGYADTSRSGTDARSSPCGSGPRTDSSSSQAGQQPESTSRSGSNRNAAPARRSTPAATDATPAQPPWCRCSCAHRAGSPSSVVMLFPATAATGVTHERISLPSSNTEQAPHCARPQPNRGPCRWSSLCNTYRSGVSRLALTPCVSPFTLIFKTTRHTIPPVVNRPIGRAAGTSPRACRMLLQRQFAETTASDKQMPIVARETAHDIEPRTRALLLE